MGYYNLVMSREAAWEIINRLGNIDSLHFQDMLPELMHTGTFPNPISNPSPSLR
jgi:hypothetical protein